MDSVANVFLPHNLIQDRILSNSGRKTGTHQVRINFKSPLVWIILLSLSTTLVVAWRHYFPEKYLFRCVGNEDITTIVAETSKESRSTRYGTEKFLKVYAYLWGTEYSLDEFSIEDCGRVMDSIVVCGSGKSNTPSYRYSEFDLDKGTHTYQWTWTGNKEETTYRGSYLKCEKTLPAIEK